ncbi:MAG: hypothetical protein IAF58_04975 [Leptolyngbya sp.]|nr:hypothetical protein [Candidatus Melainabacteria bacterium]
MSKSEPTTETRSQVSAFALAFDCAAIMLMTLVIGNLWAVLYAAKFVDEVGRECAAAAASYGDYTSAKKAVDEVLQRRKSESFLIREPYTCDIIFIETEKYPSKIQPLPGPYAKVKTTMVAWIPAPGLFVGAFNKLNMTPSTDKSLVTFTATHSYPIIDISNRDNEISGKSSI